MNNPKISIIVPVYNVEKYLRRCLDSIVMQTFTDWECICVDDGSPDGSGKILDEYAAKDKRFVIIHKENGGVSSARNAGLDIARGEYVTFCDSDDWVEADWLEAMYKAVKYNNVDMVICGISMEQRNLRQQNRCCVTEQEVYSTRNDFLKKFCSLRKQPQHDVCIHAVVNKLYSVRLLNTVRFALEIKFSEDYLFNLNVFAKVNSCVFIPEILYTYAYNQSSASHCFTEKEAEDNFKIIKLTEVFWQKENLPMIEFMIYKRNTLYSCLVKTSIHLSQETSKNRILYSRFNEYITSKVLFADFWSLKRTTFLLCCKLKLYFLMDFFAGIYLKKELVLIAEGEK